MNNTDIALYTDDTTNLNTGKTIEEALETNDQMLGKINSWFNANTWRYENLYSLSEKTASKEIRKQPNSLG